MALMRFNFSGVSSILCDTCVIDSQNNKTLIFASFVGYNAAIKTYSKMFKKQSFIYAQGSGNLQLLNNLYDINTYHTSENDFSHLIVSTKDSFINNTDQFISYLFINNNTTKENVLYDKLYKMISIPLLKEWMPYLWNELEDNEFIQPLNIATVKTEIPFEVYKLSVTENEILTFIQEALREKNLSINNSNEVSMVMNNINGLNDYLNTFGEYLANKIKNSFTPKFIPDEQEYDVQVNDFDDYCHYANIDLYKAQKVTIQAMVNHLKYENVGFVIGEMGTGNEMCI